MKKIIWILIVILGLGVLAAGFFYSSTSCPVPSSIAGKNESQIKDGDIIFQTSNSGQSKAIQVATKSKYSHCGIVYKEGNAFYVYEAVQPVKTTPLNEWIGRGEGGKYIVKRLKNADDILTPAVLKKMRQVGEQFKGKGYDLLFGWSDEKIYCSELVWKIYKRGAGIEVGKLEKLKDFDLSSDVVKNTMKQRYGNNIPLHETVVSPMAVFESDLLETIIEK
jgi:uncharacterized protein YycO